MFGHTFKPEIPTEGTTFNFTVPADCPNLQVEFPVDNGDVYLTAIRFDGFNLMYCAITRFQRSWDEWGCSEDPRNPNPNENYRCGAVRMGTFAWGGKYEIKSCLSQCVLNQCNCDNGVAATGTDCPSDEAKICMDCGVGAACSFVSL